MKQLLVLSGKGGTGKTTIVASFIELMEGKAYADCDVDAPNLHLLAQMVGDPIKADYYGMEKARINPAKCLGCGLCEDHCAFDAIEATTYEGEKVYQIKPYACEGCSVCQAVCPEGAVSMAYSKDGETMVYKDKAVFSTATLKMGSGTSGKLVTEVKKNMKNNVVEDAETVAIIDGSPGIGCPVIASVTGVSLILLVTEPTVSGFSDMKRVVEIAEHFKIPVALCTNKYDINRDKTQEIKDYAQEKNLSYVGVIPYDPGVAKATNEGLSVIRTKTKATSYIKDIYQRTNDLLKEIH